MRAAKPTFRGIAMNASGIAWNKATTTAIMNSKSAAFVMKTVTSTPKKSGPAFFHTINAITTANRIGLINLGLHGQYKLIEARNPPQKPIIASIYGGDPEITNLMQCTHDYPFTMIEINMGCPNVDEDDIVGYDFQFMESQLQKIHNANNNKYPLAVKLPYYPTQSLVQKAWDIISQFPDVVYIVAINTIPGLLTILVSPETKMEVGIGGGAIKHMALLNVYWFAQLAKKSRIDIIGCGGITSRKDVADFIAAGATYVQVGSAAWNIGPKIFATLNHQSKL